jgi:hypothetical protein
MKSQVLCGKRTGEFATWKRARIRCVIEIVPEKSFNWQKPTYKSKLHCKSQVAQVINGERI